MVIIGAGAHGMATAYYLAKRPRHQERSRCSTKLHGRGRIGPQHHHHPLQLPDARGRALLRGQREAVRDAVAGPQLQHAVLPARPPDAGPLRPLGQHDDGAGRGEPAGGGRLARRLPGRDQGAVPAAGHHRPSHVPDPGRALPPARRRSSATTRWCGATARRPTGWASRSTPTPTSPASHVENGKVTGVETNRGTINCRHGDLVHGRLEHAGLRPGRRCRCR